MSVQGLPGRCWVVRAREGQVWDVEPDVHYATAGEATAAIETEVAERTEAVFELQVAQLCVSAPLEDVRHRDTLTDDARVRLGTARVLAVVPMPTACQLVECDDCRAVLQDEAGGAIHWVPTEPLVTDLYGWSTAAGQDHCPDCSALTRGDERTTAGAGQIALPLAYPPAPGSAITPPAADRSSADPSADTDDGWG